jgi:hypothetical protein
MINLRYHIVSITAVFLALGIGLAFGAAFIDRATVDALEGNLTEIEDQNAELEQVNDDLARELVEAAEVDAGLRAEGLPQLVEGRLRDVPVLVLAAEGAGDDALAFAEQALVDAGAEVPGVLLATDRFALDDDEEVEDLRTVLGLPGAGPEQLRTAAIRRLRTIFLTASRPAEDVPGGGSGEPVPVPPLLQGLLDEGFLELDASEVPPESFAVVPEAELRLVVVSGPEAAVDEDDFIGPFLDLLVSSSPSEPSSPAPIVVAAQPPIAPPDPDAEADPPPPFVEVVRTDETVRDRLSSIDELGPFHGLLAMVLALENAPSGQLGHYGTSDSAQRLLPAPVEPGADAGDGGDGGDGGG